MSNSIQKGNSTRQSGNNGTTTYRPSFSGLLDDFFDTSIDRFFNTPGLAGLSRKSQVPVNIRESGKGYELELVAPGLRKQDFRIDVDGHLLTVSFDHQEENNQENKEKGWIRQEYSRQSFSRSFTLDETIDADRIEAQYNDGMLHLIIPKREGSSNPKKSISVK